MRMRLSLYILAAAIVIPADLPGQEGPIVREGDQVRVRTTDSADTCAGRLVGRASDTLTVDCWQPAAGEWQLIAFPISSIKSLEVQRGTRTNAGKGALLGGLIGGGFGLAVGVAAAVDDCSTDAWNWDWCWLPGEEEMIPLSTATFALVGAGVGALIGTLSRSERWLPIRPDDLRVQVSGAGVGVSLSIPVGCCSRPVGAD